jgi:uncharacterized membrane protein YdjX (TVP38/TMEM64 family)
MKENEPVNGPQLSPKGNLDGKGSKKTNLWRPLLLILLVVGLLISAKTLGLGEKVASLRIWIKGLGPWGPLAFIIIYIGAVVAAVPGSAITLAGGALFGSLFGVILVSIASTAGAVLSFLIARYFARNSISGWLENNDKFNRLDRLTEDHGDIIVALTRLVPVFPFNLLNYGFGLTRVKFSTYVLWSWLCMLPGTILYVVGADTLTKGIARGKVPWTLIIVGGITAVILFVLIQGARKKLKEKEAMTGAPTDVA